MTGPISENPPPPQGGNGRPRKGVLPDVVPHGLFERHIPPPPSQPPPPRPAKTAPSSGPVLKPFEVAQQLVSDCKKLLEEQDKGKITKAIIELRQKWVSFLSQRPDKEEIKQELNSLCPIAASFLPRDNQSLFFSYLRQVVPSDYNLYSSVYEGLKNLFDFILSPHEQQRQLPPHVMQCVQTLSERGFLITEVKGPAYRSVYILKMFDGEGRELYYVIPPPTQQKTIDRPKRNFAIRPYKALEVPASIKEGGRPLTGPLYVFTTLGDGACAIHALLGKPTNDKSMYACPDVDKEKKAFCDHLRALRRKGNLPEGIGNLFEDFFLNFEDAPKKFQEKIAPLYQKLHSGYAKLSPAEQDARKEAFCTSNEVFEAYLSAFSGRGYYLFQTELIEMAKFKNLALRLWQSGWGEARSDLTSEIFNEGSGREIVEIYFDAPGHYSKAMRF